MVLLVNGHTGGPLLNADGAGRLRRRGDREHIDQAGASSGDNGFASAEIYGDAVGNGIGSEGRGHAVIDDVDDGNVAARVGCYRQARLRIYRDSLGTCSDSK